MIGFLVRKIFGSKNDRFLKKLRPLVAKINALEPEMQALADEELPQRLAVYREQVQNGEKDLDAVLPEVFALVREASTRVYAALRCAAARRYGFAQRQDC